MLQAQTHSYVLYVIAMHTGGIIDYFKLSSGLFGPRSSLLPVLQSQAYTHKKWYRD